MVFDRVLYRVIRNAAVREYDYISQGATTNFVLWPGATKERLRKLRMKSVVDYKFVSPGSKYLFWYIAVLHALFSGHGGANYFLACATDYVYIVMSCKLIPQIVSIPLTFYHELHYYAYHDVILFANN